MDLAVFEAYRAAAPGSKEKETLRSKLLRDNDMLVRKLALKLYNRAQAGGGAGYIELEDFFQAGRIAFCTCLERFDPKKARFSTYLTHWVRHEAQNATFVQSGIIKRPRTAGVPYKVFRAADAHYARTGVDATPQELHDVTGLPVTEASVREWAEGPSVTVSISEVRPGPLCESTGVEGTQPLETHIPGSLPGVDEQIEECETKQILRQTMGGLPEREQRILTALFWEDRRPEDVAVSEGLSLEHVRRLKLKALETIRAALEAP